MNIRIFVVASCTLVFAAMSLAQPPAETLKELQPRKATLKVSDGKLKTALDSLKKQTGMTLEDRRQSKTNDAVTFELADATYWQCAEALAAKTNSRLSLYQADGKVALIDGPNPKLQVHLHGAFRVAVKHIVTKLDFDSQTHATVLGLEIAWEPRFSPYLIEIGKLSYSTPALLKEHAPMSHAVPGRGPVVVTEHNAKEFDILFPSPPRAVLSILNVHGQFVVTMPSKSLQFIFKKPVQGENLGLDGVQVKLAEITANKEKWKVQLAVEVPAGGPSFASFQTWLGSKAWLDQCSCHLERTADGTKEILRPDHPLHTHVGNPTATKIAVSYQFTPPKNAGQIADWRLVYRVPGRMVEVTVPLVFDKINLS